ncbi:alternative ribosome rescue aminoacyl-tRNA hydrolase ArfB [Sphingobacterium sp. LRF_L2]|uniref:alternative ribosome rescue aminoacyl-tRNA hydrolase ArfB n=1 Tax=Sphingobacterium sp. LRF_L2 TaxID=3369421 RepID=UPI003F5DC0C0
MELNKELLMRELFFSTARSGGAGGQHVNKVESKVSLFWNIHASQCLRADQRQRLQDKLSNKISKDGILQLDASDTRSQFKNKEIVIERFLTLLAKALQQEKKRIATKIPKSQVLDRLDRKKKQGQKKSLRRRIDFD